MQALVLAGGEGTRLRPLTLSVPKAVMPLAGRPFLSFMLDWLARHGVAEAILSCGFLSEAVARTLGDSYGGMRLRYLIEPEPLGTAGPLRLAADSGMLEGRLFVLNGDVLTDIDLSAQLASHEATGAAATLALIPVEDTSSYGVVPSEDSGRVQAFLEKSAGPAPTNRINAGAYVVERALVERIPPGRPVSFEREVFPKLVEDGTLYGFAAEGYWLDIGTPERYLEGTYDLLRGRVASSLTERDSSGSLVDESAVVATGHVGSLSVIGAGSTLGEGSAVDRSVLHERVSVGSGCRISESVLADEVVVGDRAQIGPDAVVGRAAEVAPGAIVERGARIAPGERVREGP